MPIFRATQDFSEVYSTSGNSLFSNPKLLIKAAKTVKRYWDGIVKWYESKINNGILEGLNSVIQAAKSKARGYKTFKNYKIIIYLFNSKVREI